MLLKNEINCADVVKKLKKAFDEYSIHEWPVYIWYKHFQDGPESVEDDDGVGSTSMTSKKSGRS